MSDNHFPDFIAPSGVMPLTPEPSTALEPTLQDATESINSETPTTQHRPSQRTIVTTGIVVVAMVIAGLAMWFVQKQILNPAPACGAISSAGYTTSDGSFPSLAVALLDGQQTPTRVEVVGVWCDVALMDLEYQQTENLNGDHAYTYFYTDVLRAVDISTGKVLWTLDKSPDGSPLMFNSAVASGGKLALATMRDGGFTQPGAELCISGTDLRIVNLHTGRAMASAFLDGQCSPATDDADTESTVASAVAYQDGVVVIELAKGNVPILMTGGTISTSGYQDTDLTKALWTVNSPNTNHTGQYLLDHQTDRTLPGGWVRTAPNGMYVPIATGTSSRASGDGNIRSFFTAGDLAIEAVSSVAGSDGFVGIGGWSDLAASGPGWTYNAPDGWAIAPDAYLMNDFPYPQSVSPVVAVTSSAVIVMEQRSDDSGVIEANLTALNKANGAILWSTPYEFATSDLSTVTVFSTQPGGGTAKTLSKLARAQGTVIQSGGQEYLVYTQPGSVVLADATTGKVISSQMLSVRTASGIYQCGDASVCVAVDFHSAPWQVTTTGMMKMSVSATALGTPSETDLTLVTSGYATTNVGYDGLYPTEAGLFAVVRDGSDYQFLLM